MKNQSNSYHYNPFRTPSNWDIARDHAQSVRPGISNYQLSDQQINCIQLCPCCYHQISKQPLRINVPLNEMREIGCSYPLFYSFVKFCILSLLVLMINTSLLELYDTLYWSSVSSEDHKLFTVYISTVSLNIGGGRFQMMSVISFFSQMLLLIYFRRNQLFSYKYLYKQIDENQSHYSLLFYNFPQGNDSNEQKIKNYIQRLIPEVSVDQVLVILDMKQYYHAEEQARKQICKWKKILGQDKKNNEEMLNILKNIGQKVQNVKNKKQRIRCNQRIYFKGISIVTFNTKNDRDLVLKFKNINNIGFLQEFFENIQVQNQIKVEEIGNPQQILWQNLSLTMNQHQSFLGRGNIITLTILAVFFLIYYIFQYMFHSIKIKVEDNVNWKIVPSVLLMFIICLSNKFALTKLIHKVCHKEYHKSITSEVVSFTFKLTICVFITTAIMVLLVQGIIYQNFTDNFGLIQEETIMFLINCLFIPILWLINPWYIVHKINKYIYNDRKALSQQQANNLLQLPQYDIGKRYADVIKTFWFTFMYSNLIPLGPLLSIFGLSCFYWIDKYNLLRKSSLTPPVSLNLSKQMTKLLDLTLVIKPLGNFTLVYLIQDIFSSTDMILFIIGLLYVLLPIDNIIQWFFSQINQNQQDKNRPFKQAKSNFKTLYNLQFPITSEVQNKLEFLRLKNPNFNLKDYQQTPRKVQIYENTKNTSTLNQDDIDINKIVSDRNMIAQKVA